MKILFTIFSVFFISISGLQAILPPKFDLEKVNSKKTKKESFSKHQCQAFIKQMEKDNAIPEGLLMALAAVESEHNPWAINCGNFSGSFSSQEAAVKFVKDLRIQGKLDINIGILQINYAAHKDKFKTAEEILNPIKNITYAAKYLVYLKKLYGSWKKAVCFYHSPCKKYQDMYLNKVTKILKKDNVKTYLLLTEHKSDLNLKQARSN